MTERQDLTKEEKLKVLESAIDRWKANKKSKFNELFRTPVQFNIECNLLVISAELYTREEALQKIREFLKGEDQYMLEEIAEMIPEMLSFDYVSMRYMEEVGGRVRCIWDSNPDKLTNFDKPVYYL